MHSRVVRFLNFWNFISPERGGDSGGYFPSRIGKCQQTLVLPLKQLYYFLSRPNFPFSDTPLPFQDCGRWGFLIERLITACDQICWPWSAFMHSKWRQELRFGRSDEKGIINPFQNPKLKDGDIMHLMACINLWSELEHGPAAVDYARDGSKAYAGYQIEQQLWTCATLARVYLNFVSESGVMWWASFLRVTQQTHPGSIKPAPLRIAVLTVQFCR